METLAPSVVIVLVTHDPGEWFEETLRSMRDLDYRETSLLVVDNASSEDPTTRVAEILPEAFVVRLDTNKGFGPAANVAAAMVEGANFLVFAHDDVAPDPVALRYMIEEAFRSNAGVIGPKFVEWDHPEKILHVGVEVDKSGAVVDRSERGEYDHGQHDAVRDVFCTSGGFTLVRSDLFSELGGFDPHISVMGEDLDFCWRAQIAGARVIVAPDARVRHLELLAGGSRTPDCATPVSPRRRTPATTESSSEAEPNEAIRAAATLEVGSETGAEELRTPSVHELQRRAELHASLKAYGTAHRIRVFPQMVLFAFAELLALLAVGRTSQAGDVWQAWRWNFSIRGETRTERRALKKLRSVPDSEVRHLQVRGSVRVNRFVRQAFSQGLGALRLDAGPDGVAGGKSADGDFRTREAISDERFANLKRNSSKIAAWLVAVLFLIFASRNLITGGFPAVGQFLPLPSAGTLLSQFVNGHHQFASNTALPSTPATLLLGVAGYILLGSTGLLQTALALSCLPIGALGVARISKRFGHRWAPFIAAACYLAIPLPYDDIATGRLDALFAYAAVPWLTLGLARASGLEPFGATAASDPDVETPALAIGRRSSSWVRRLIPTNLRLLLGLGIGEALLVAFDPSASLLIVVIAIGLALAIFVTGAGQPGQGSESPTRSAGSGRPVADAVGRLVGSTIWSIAIAIVLLFPWSVSVLAGNPLEVLANGRGGPGAGFGWAELLRLSPGPIGDSVLVFGLLGAGALALGVGRRWRFSWSARMWVCALLSWFVALGSERGWLGSVSFVPAVVLPIAACGIACSAALGVAAFRADVPASRFGWRQVASLLAGTIGIVGALPVIAASSTGRFDIPPTGYAQVLSWMQTQPNAGRSGVLWLGDQSVIPGRAWSVQADLDYTLSSAQMPDLTSVWPAPPSNVETRTASAIRVALRGGTAALGSYLAQDSVRYVVVVSALAPNIPGVQQTQPTYLPGALLPALESQNDLRQLAIEGSQYAVFVNSEFVSRSPAAVREPTLNGLAVSLELVIWVAVLFVVVSRRRRTTDKNPNGPRSHAHQGRSGYFSSPTASYGAHSARAAGRTQSPDTEDETSEDLDASDEMSGTPDDGPNGAWSSIRFVTGSDSEDRTESGDTAVIDHGAEPVEGAEPSAETSTEGRDKEQKRIFGSHRQRRSVTAVTKQTHG